MKKMLSVGIALLAACACFAEATPKKVAVFVQNRAKTAGMDDEVAGIRDRFTSALAEIEGISVVDSSLSADTFRAYKITTDEEKAGFYSGIYSGGSVPNIAKTLGCDYVLAVTVVGATSMQRTIGGKSATVFTLRMSMKAMDATGASIDGMPTWVRQLPIQEAADEPMTYYSMLLDQWAEEAAKAVAEKQLKWPAPNAIATKTVAFTVSTTIDKVVEALESQTKGTKGETLAELRKVVGGATVELDGAVIGSAPGELRATPGLHQIKIVREWMKPYTATINVTEGMKLDVAMELSVEGIAKWGTVEALRANVAQRYADAAMERGLKVNIDTANWRDVSAGDEGRMIIKDAR